MRRDVPSLILMARRPIYGKGKRRLAAALGNHVAHRFQRFALMRLAHRLGRDPRWRLWLALTPDRPSHNRDAADVIAQGAGDLGARMTRVSQRLGPGPIIFIGSDTPDISRRDVWRAFAALRRADAVIGPARDGGYWLIGFTQAQRRRLPFAGVRWSTQHTRQDTIKQLSGVRIEMLQEREDVDDADSFRRWKQAACKGRGQ
jgi:rSAM/selenodomain-associated transferase 1